MKHNVKIQERTQFLFQTPTYQLTKRLRDHNSAGEFMYMPVNIKGLQVAALLDTGSSINTISKSLFNKLPNNGKFNFRSGSEQTVKLANNQYKLFDPHSLV